MAGGEYLSQTDSFREVSAGMGKKQNSLYGALSFCCQKWCIDAQDDKNLQASAVFLFPATYVGFAGHFPSHPILPAIIQLAVVRYLCELALGKSLLPGDFNRIKFKGMIRPDERVLVTIDLSESEAQWSGTFSLQRPDKEIVASGMVAFFNH